jgi:hypothetical protein
VQLARNVTGRLRPPAFFCQADPVFACNHAAPRQHLCEKIVEGALDFFANGRVAIVSIRHDVDVNVAVSSMAEAGDGKSVLRL